MQGVAGQNQVVTSSRQEAEAAREQGPWTATRWGILILCGDLSGAPLPDYRAWCWGGPAGGPCLLLGRL